MLLYNMIWYNMSLKYDAISKNDGNYMENYFTNFHNF